MSNNIRNKGGDSIDSRVSDEKQHGDVEEEAVSKKKNEGEELEL